MAARLSAVLAFFVERASEAFCSACIARAVKLAPDEVDESLGFLAPDRRREGRHRLFGMPSADSAVSEVSAAHAAV